MTALADTSGRAGRRGSRALTLSLRPSSVLIFCLFVQGWLVILHLHLTRDSNPGVAILGQPFDLLRESSVPTMWAVLQALSVAVVAGLITGVMRIDGVARSGRDGWIVAAVLFLLIGIDDAAGIHERLGAITSLRLMTEIGYPSYPWHIVVAPVFVVLLALAVYLLWSDLGKFRWCRLMVVLAVGCYGFSQLIDFAEGIDAMSAGAIFAPAPAFPRWMIIEEVLEMAGTALFLCAFLTVLKGLLEGRAMQIARERAAGRDPA